jgi:hypothetical protein
MSKIYTIVRHGKRIEVEELDPPKSSRSAKKLGHEPFAKMHLKDAAALAKAMGSPRVLIASLLIHLAWKTKSATFPLSNEMLARYGVNRWAKYRALKRLEKAGKISFRTDPGKATIVTLLVAPEDVPTL